MTQAQYSANSGGSYARAETREIVAGGLRRFTHHVHRETADLLPVVVKVRMFRDSVVVLTDKPQKPLPESLWNDLRPAMRDEVAARISELSEAFRVRFSSDWTPEQAELVRKARVCGLAYYSSMTQYGFTEAGAALVGA